MNIRARLLSTYLAVTALAILVLGSYHFSSFQSYFIQSTRADLAARAEALAFSVSEALADGDLSRVDSLVRLNSTQAGVNIRVIGMDGRLIATSMPELDRRREDWSGVPGVSEALAGRHQSGIAQGVFARGDRYYDARPLDTGGRRLGVLRMALSLKLFQHQMQSSLFTIAGIALLAFGLCSVASYWLARGMALPISKMRNFAVLVGSGNFNSKLDLQRIDELGELARELQSMSSRLATLDEERRGFLANVAHELRTPLTNAEVTLEALACGADAEPDLRVRFIQAAQDELLRLRNLVQDLLQLGRLEAGFGQLDCEPVRLPALVDHTLRAMEPRLASRNINIFCQVPDLLVELDRERMTQVLMNLLDNALKHSRDGSAVRIRGRVSRQRVQMEVEDQGCGIAGEDLPHIFEQFYVSDRSRKGQGTGLGLAIARRIVEAHGGVIVASSAPGRGAVFTVELPLTQGVKPAGGGRGPGNSFPQEDGGDGDPGHSSRSIQSESGEGLSRSAGDSCPPGNETDHR